MNRTPILLVALLALLVAACSSEQSAPTDAQPTVTVEATPEPTAEPTDEATDAPDDGTSLEDLIPDELNGMARTDIPGMDQMIASALQGQGMDADEAEFVFTSYGDAGGTDAVILTAFRIPGMGDAELEALARLMSGAQSEGGSAEAVTVGGKSVLRMTADEADGAAYLYFANGAVFTVVGESEDLAEQLLSELP